MRCARSLPTVAFIGIMGGYAVVAVLFLCVSQSLAFLGLSSRRGLRRKVHEPPSLHLSSKSSPPEVAPAYYLMDLYGVLGVPKNSTSPEVRKAYMRIAFDNHPDKNNSAAALDLFRNATFAYQTFKDPKMRRQYDNRAKSEAALTAFEVRR